MCCYKYSHEILEFLLLQNRISFVTVDIPHSKENRKPNNRKASSETVENAIKRTFKKSLKDFKDSQNELAVGDFVLARMRGFKPWPAKITSLTKKGAVCYFYGSHNNGPVSLNEIIPFFEGLESIRLIRIRPPKDFEKGIREIEIENNIPEELSSLRDTGLLQNT